MVRLLSRSILFFRFEQSYKISHFPQPGSNASRHRRCHAQRTMNPHEVLGKIIQYDGSRMILYLA
jgi:hypothetical protein